MSYGRRNSNQATIEGDAALLNAGLDHYIDTAKGQSAAEMETIRDLRSQTRSTVNARNLQVSDAFSWPTCASEQSPVQRPTRTNGHYNTEESSPRTEGYNNSGGHACDKSDPLSRIKIVHGDIIAQKGDFIVNAANPAMMGGAGIDKAIHDAAGPELYAYEDELRREFGREPCPTGRAVLTPAFKLEKRFSGIIHTAGPRLHPHARPQPEDAMLLRSCYRNSLEIVTQEGKSSVFPLISSGFFYYPVELSAPVILDEIASFLHSHKDIKRVLLCSTDKQQVDVMKTELNRLREPPSPPTSLVRRPIVTKL